MKTFQSALVRQPNVAPSAVSQVSVPATFESPVPVSEVKYSLLTPRTDVYMLVPVALVSRVLPVAVKSPSTVDEAVAIRLASVVRPVTFSVLFTVVPPFRTVAPVAVNAPSTVDDAVAIRLDTVERPDTVSVSFSAVAPSTVSVPSSRDAFETKSSDVVAVPVIARVVPVAFPKSNGPLTVVVPVNVDVPVTVRLESTVDEDVKSAPLANVQVAVMFSATLLRVIREFA